MLPFSGPFDHPMPSPGDENPIGRRTLKLQSQAIVDEGRRRVSQPQGMSRAPQPSMDYINFDRTAAQNSNQNEAQTAQPPAWQLTDQMMHQPWGTVLRALQPGALQQRR